MRSNDGGLVKRWRHPRHAPDAPAGVSWRHHVRWSRPALVILNGIDGLDRNRRRDQQFLRQQQVRQIDRGVVGRGGDEKNHDEDVGVRLPRCARGARSYHLLIIDRASSSARSRGPVTTLLGPSKPPG
jgi:hypothetical protein